MATNPTEPKKKPESSAEPSLSARLQRQNDDAGAKLEVVVKQESPSTKPVSAGVAIPAPQGSLAQATRKAKREPSTTAGPRPAESKDGMQSPLVSPEPAKTVLKDLTPAPPPAPARGERIVRDRGQDKLEKAREKREKSHAKLARDLAKHTEVARKVSERLGLDPNRPITEIPPLPENEFSQVEFATVQENRAYIRIAFNRKNNTYLYEVIEPQLTETESELLDLIRDTLVRTLEARYREEEDRAESYLVRSVDQAILDHSILIDEVSRRRIEYYILRDFLGYGAIDVFMRDPMIEDISCDGPRVPLFLFHRNYESIKTNVVFQQEVTLDSFVIRLAQRCGKQISIAEPLLDATMPDTSRLQASLSKEVTTRGSSFTIRKFRADPLTPTDLIRLGTMNAQIAGYFWLAMEEGASIIYAGGTASGKTTTLNAVSTFIPPQKKIVSIEDTREIHLPHENWIAGLTRSGFGGEVVGGKIAGTIDMYRLLEAALRQRPEYLLVGEVRGPEAQTLFQAMATGHATSSTLHGDSVMSAVYRLENPPISVPRIMLQTLSAIAVQVQARVNHRLVRRLKEVVEIVGIDPDTKDLLTNALFLWDHGTDTYRYLGKSVILERVMQKRNWTTQRVEEEWENRTLILEWMLQKGIRRIDEVTSIISAYYNTPKQLLDKVREQMEKPGPEVGGLPRGT